MVQDLLIFDCDGVLVDSEPIACRVEAELLTEAGFAITAEEVIRRFVGRGPKALHAAMAEQYGRPLPPDLPVRAASALLAAFERELRPMPGIADALDRLPQRRCVASSSPPERIERSLRLAGLWDRLAPHLFSATMVERPKPAPDLFLHAAGRMGAAPSDCLVIEDSVAGVEAAVAAGMRVLGFVGGGHCTPDHAERLGAAGAERVFGRMEELPGLVAEAEDRSR